MEVLPEDVGEVGGVAGVEEVEGRGEVLPGVVWEDECDWAWQGRQGPEINYLELEI